MRKPSHNYYPELKFMTNSRGEIWINFSIWLRFQLKFVNFQYWASSPVIRGITLVDSQETYEADKSQIPHEHQLLIEKCARRYANTFKIIKEVEFDNWLNRNYILSNSFSDFNVSPIDDDKPIVEIGPGLGAILALGAISKPKVMYSFDTFEMQTVFSAILKQFAKDFERLNMVAINDPRNKRPFKIDVRASNVLAFWSFTEIKEEERNAYFDLFREASNIIIGSNEYFEGINNFDFIEKMAIELDKKVSWKTLDKVFATSLPSYQRHHRIYLLQAK